MLFAATVAMTLLWMWMLRDGDRAPESSIALLERGHRIVASPKTRAAAVGVLVLIACVVWSFR